MVSRDHGRLGEGDPPPLVKFGLLFLATVAAVTVAHVALMKTIDPRGDFGMGLFPSVVYDARAQKVARFTAYLARGPVDGVVLGSSRSLKIRPADLAERTGLRFFNFAVEGARSDDMLAIYWWMRERGVRPKVLWLGLDVESLIVTEGLHWKLEQNAALMRALAGAQGAVPSRFDDARALVAAAKRTVTFGYLRDAVLAVRLRFRPGANLLNTAFEPDGYFRYPRWELERAKGVSTFDQTFADCLDGHTRNYDVATAGIRPHHVERLEQLIRQARADGVRVTLWLTGVHPQIVQYLRERTTYEVRLVETRRIVEGWRARYGIETSDLTDMTNYAGTADGWYDCGHPDEGNARRIVEAVMRTSR